MKPTVAIVGVGLIGGSLGQALRRTRRYRVLGLGRRWSALQAAHRRGAVDAFSTRWSEVSQASLVVIATPVNAIIPTLRKLLPFLQSGAIVTDVGSVKGPILDQWYRLPPPRGVRFIGGHPLAGSHLTGIEAARPDLFQGAACVLVPGDRTALPVVQRLWRSVGARTCLLSAAAHDRSAALISHLPHAAAHAMVRLVSRHPDRKMLIPLLAGSFRDMTRVASSDSDQWAQILSGNAASIRQAIRQFIKELSRFERKLSDPSLKTDLRRSRAFREPLFHGR